MELELVTQPERLAAVTADWEKLLRQSTCDVPTLSPLWLLPWWQMYGTTQGRRLKTALLWDNGRLVGLAPLLSRRLGSGTGVPVRRIELLASGEEEHEEVCSSYIGVISERGREQAVSEELTRALRGGQFGRWDDLLLVSMDASQVLPPVFAACLSKGAHYAITGTCPVVRLPSSWSAYLASLPEPNRRVVEQAERDFEAWAGRDVSFHVARDRSDLELGRKLLETLHSERRASLEKPSVFQHVRFRAFHDRVMLPLFERGALELCWLTAKDQPICAMYNIVWNDRVFFYQGGRTTRIPDHLRPTVVGHAYAIRRAIEAGRVEYDFMGRAAHYKLDLAHEFRPLGTLYATQGTLLPRMRLAGDYLSSAARQLYRRWRPLEQPPLT